RPGGELLQQFPAQFLRFAEVPLIIQKLAVQLQRRLGLQVRAQKHIAHMHRIGQHGFLIQLFERGLWRVVIHRNWTLRKLLDGEYRYSIPQLRNGSIYSICVPQRSCKCTSPRRAPTSSTTASEVMRRCSIKASAAAANSCGAMVRGEGVIQSAAVSSKTAVPFREARLWRSNKRRRSPSLMMPSSLSPSTTVVTPRPLRDIS